MLGGGGAELKLCATVLLVYREEVEVWIWQLNICRGERESFEELKTRIANGDTHPLFYFLEKGDIVNI